MREQKTVICWYEYNLIIRKEFLKVYFTNFSLISLKGFSDFFFVFSTNPKKEVFKSSTTENETNLLS